MSNERRLRLHQVARELKVGQTTIIEFLEKKGIKVDNSPSSIIEPAAYAILDKEFGGNKHIEKVNIREKINLKHESVSLDDRKENEQNGSDDGADFKNEVIIKSGVINVKDEVARMATPKILGKIDLSDNHNSGPSALLQSIYRTTTRRKIRRNRLRRKNLKLRRRLPSRPP